MLWNLRDSKAKALEFFEDFTYTIRQSVATPVLKEGRRQMEAKSQTLGVLFLICHCAANLGEWKASDEPALRL